MKKNWLFLVFLILTGASSFARDQRTYRPNDISLYIYGFGSDEYQAALFREALTTEAIAAGYNVTDTFRNADYGVRFEITLDPSETQYILQVRLIRMEDLFTIVTSDYLFADFEEMLPQNQPLFFMLMSNLPAAHGAVRRGGGNNEDWNNKWLYLRLSLDYPIVFYLLKNDGLYRKSAVYEGTLEDPTDFWPLDNIIVALPGGTLGLELQFLNWMSIEPMVQASWENLNEQDFVNVAAGVELKFPIKMKNVMLEPYGLVSYPVYSSLPSTFKSSPLMAFGGGLQFGINGGRAGAVFLDVNYMYYCFVQQPKKFLSFLGSNVNKNVCVVFYAVLYPFYG